MKNIIYSLLLFICCITISCSNDNFEEMDLDSEVDLPPNVVTTPCDFDLSNVATGTTIILNCILDLKGETITLPPNVKFEFEGGDIKNGKLIFNGGTIAGELLNSSLEIEGDVKLENPVFKFYAVRWEIVEGKVDQPTAYKNHEYIQKVVDIVKGLGATTFEINHINAFFESNNGVFSNTPVVELPSDLHFKMSDNSYLRVFPVDEIYSARIFRISGKKNIIVSGGHLIGDRLNHGPTDGGNVLFEIKGGQDVIIDNVEMSFSSSSGLTVNSVLFPNDADYFPSKNVVIKNCLFDSNRTNNLSVTDGMDITIDNCKLYRAGIDLKGQFGPSIGVAPRIGIVVEPVQGQVVDRVHIKNNTVDESRTNSILAAGGYNIIISGNTADAPVGWTTATNAQVINNPGLNGGIIGGLDLPYALSVSANNIISGNTVRNTNTGIYATNDDIKIFNNKIIDCNNGIMVRNLADSEIYNNTITSSKEGSFGISGQKSANNVVVRNNTVKLSDGRSINMVGMNKESEFEENKLTIRNNTFECGKSGIITFSNGIDVDDNNFTLSGFGLTNSINISVKNNTIISQSENAFSINKTESTKNIAVTGNTFNNTSSTRLGAYGVRIYTVGNDAATEDSNITFNNNKINVKGTNYGLHIKNFDGMSITDNTIEIQDLVSIFFRGNNSTIQNNNVSSVDIEGTNNTVSNNQ